MKSKMLAPAMLHFLMLFTLSTAEVFNLTDFGAKGDNKTLNTHAFEMAVAAVEKAGGGTLYVPDGVYITAPFNLTSHMILFLSGQAEIRGPTEDQLGPAPDFPLWPVIPAMPSYGQGRDHTGTTLLANCLGIVSKIIVTIHSTSE